MSINADNLMEKQRLSLKSDMALMSYESLHVHSVPFLIQFALAQSWF